MFSAAALVLGLCMARSASGSCLHGTSFYPRTLTARDTVEVSKFGYSGDRGPLNWAGLSPNNTVCRTGKVQSPIVLDHTIHHAWSAPKLDIPDVWHAELENLGTTLEVIVGGTLTFDKKEYKLKQFHFHTPSEHRIHEEHFPLEMHMVHEGEGGAILVVAIPFQLSEDGITAELLAGVIVNLSKVSKPGTVTETGALHFKELIKAVETHPLFQYSGSLTTPPCKEGVTFLVMEEPMALNVRTYNNLKAIIKFNARYSQNAPGEANLLDIAAKLAQENEGNACSTQPDWQSHAGSEIEKISMWKVKNSCSEICGSNDKDFSICTQWCKCS